MKLKKIGKLGVGAIALFSILVLVFNITAPSDEVKYSAEVSSETSPKTEDDSSVDDNPNSGESSSDVSVENTESGSSDEPSVAMPEDYAPVSYLPEEENMSSEAVSGEHPNPAEQYFAATNTTLYDSSKPIQADESSDPGTEDLGVDSEIEYLAATSSNPPYDERDAYLDDDELAEVVKLSSQQEGVSPFSTSVTASYKTNHISGTWGSYYANGAQSGSPGGSPIEAIMFSLSKSSNMSGNIQYSVTSDGNVSNGAYWTPWVIQGNTAGTLDQGNELLGATADFTGGDIDTYWNAETYLYMDAASNGWYGPYVEGAKVEWNDSDGSIDTNSNHIEAYKCYVEQAVPVVPSNISFSNVTQSSFTVNWTGHENTTTYEIYVNGAYKGSTSGTSYTVSGLSSGTNYGVQVKAVNSGGWYTTGTYYKETIPATPSGVASTYIDDDAITLDCDTETGADAYYWYKNGTKIANTSSSVTDYQFTGLSPNTTYTLGVASHNTGGTSPIATKSVKTAPATPSNFRVTASDSDSVTLAWDAETGATSYKVYKNGTLLASPTGTSYTVTGLSPNTTYTFEVESYNGAYSDPATISVTTGAPPPPPTNLTTSNVTTNSATLNWTGSTATAQSGTVTGSTATAQSGTVGSDSGSLGTVNLNYTITQDPVARTSTISISRSSNIDSNDYDHTHGSYYSMDGVATSSITVTHDSNGIPSDSSISVASGIDYTDEDCETIESYDISGTISVPNMEPSQDISYDVYVGNTYIGTTTEESYTFTNLPSGTTSTLGVVAKNDSGSSPKSTTTVLTIPATPAGLSVSNVTPNSATLNWTDVSGDAGYDIYLDGVKVADLPTGTTSYNIAGLDPNTTYTLGVRSKNASGYSPVASISVTTPSGIPATPTGLTVSNISQTGATLSWSPSANATSYDLYVGNTYIGNTSNTSYNFTNLPCGTTSSLGVVAKNSSGSSAKATTNVLTKPASPANLTSSVTSNSATLTWSPTTGATSYDLYLNGTYVTNTSSTTYTFNNLSPGTPYTLGVVAKNSSGSSGTSTKSVTTTIPAPSGLTVSNISQTGATLTWSPVTGATSYDLYVGNTLITNVPSSTTSYNFTSLPSGTSSNLGVVAKNSNVSSSKATTNVLTKPANPVGLATSNVTATGATLTWTPTTGATSYDVYLNGSKVTNTANSTYTFTLTPGTSNTLGVAAVNASGASGVSTISATTGIATPTNLTISNITQTGGTLTWSPVTGATSYDIYLNGSKIGNTTTTSYTYTGLNPGTNYTLGVVAKTSAASSAQATKPLLTKPANPAGLAVSNISPTSATLSWSGATSATSYDVFLNGTNIGNTTSTSYNFTGLTPGTTYTLGVQSKNASGNSSTSTINVTTTISAPSNLTVSNITQTGATLSWSAVSEATSYDVYLNGTKVGNTTSTSYAYTGLNPGTNYTLGVVAKTSAASSAQSTKSVLTKPANPSNLSTSNITQTSATLSWSTVSSATSYDVYLNGSKIGNTTGTSFNFTGLTPGTTYTLGVSANNTSGSSGISSTSILTVPANPTGLTASNITNNSVTLTWTPTTGATSYDVYLNNSLVTNVTGNSYTFSGLANGTTYTLGVKAKNSTSSSGMSTLNVTTLLPAPSGLTVSNITQNSATLSWSSVSNATSYDVYLNGSKVTNVTGTSYTFTGLNPGTSYTLGVTAKNSAATSTQSTTTVLTKPGNPSGLKTSNITQTSATLSWSPITSASSYDVYLNGAKVGNTTATSYNFTELTSGTTHTLGVVAKNPSGDSGLSTTTVLTIPSNPSGLSSSDITSNSATLNWNLTSGATSYNVYLNGTLVDTVDGSVSSYNFTGLPSGAISSLGVAAINSSGSSSIVELDVLTLPANPSGLTVTNITQTSATLNWSPVNGATEYEVYLDGNLVGTVSSTSYNYTELNPGTTHTLGVKSKNASGTSSLSTITVLTIPSNPSGLTIEEVTTDSVTISWNSTTGATSYDVYNGSNLVDTITTTTYTFRSLEPGTPYTFGVVAENASGESGMSTISAITHLAPPEGLTSSNIATDSITISWGAVPNADGYNVYQDGVKIGTTSDLSFTFSSLNPDTEYVFEVEAFNADTTSAKASITESTLPLAPTNLVVLDVKADQAPLSWDAVPGAVSYNIYLNGIYVTNTIDTSYIYLGLDPATDYTLGVQTVGTYGHVSSIATIQTKTLLETPTNLQVTEIGDTNASIVWDPVPGAVSYDIYVYDSLVGTTTETSYDISGLSYEQEYNFGVEANSDDGTYDSEIANVLGSTEPQTPPQAPLNLQVTDATNDSITVTWDAPEDDIDKYNVYINDIYYTSTTDTEFTFYGLDPATDYSIDVTSQKYLLESEKVGVDDNTAPDAPTNLTHTVINNVDSSITWDMVTGAEYYNVYLGGYGPEYKVGTTTETRYDFTELMPETEYTIYVEAVKGVRASTPSELVFNTPIAPPAAPTGLTLSEFTKNSVKMDWTAPTGQVDGYHLYLNGEFVATVTTDTIYVFTNLQPATSYEFSVRAYNTAGMSPPAVVTDNTAPEEVMSLTQVQTGSSDSITISWDAVPGATSYDVYLDSESSSSFGSTVKSIAVDPNELVGTTTGLSYEITGLTPDTSYTIYVTAKCGNQVSDPTMLVARTNTDYIPPVSTNSFGLSWDVATGADSYNVYVDGVYNGTTNSLSYQVSNLEPATSYEFGVSAVNTSGESETVTFVDNTTPEAPLNVHVTGKTDVQIDIAWNAVTGADYYNVYVDGVYYDSTSETTMNITGLNPDTLYDISVAAVTGAREGNPTTIAERTRPVQETEKWVFYYHSASDAPTDQELPNTGTAVEPFIVETSTDPIYPVIYEGTFESNSGDFETSKAYAESYIQQAHMFDANYYVVAVPISNWTDEYGYDPINWNGEAQYFWFLPEFTEEWNFYIHNAPGLTAADVEGDFGPATAPWIKTSFQGHEVNYAVTITEEYKDFNEATDALVEDITYLQPNLPQGTYLVNATAVSNCNNEDWDTSAQYFWLNIRNEGGVSDIRLVE